MRKISRKRKEDFIAGILLFFLIIFLSGQIFSAGWDEFYATTEIIDCSENLAETESTNESEGSVLDSGEEERNVSDGRTFDIHCLVYFQRAYPDVNFARGWDQEVEDWIITVTTPANGKGPNVRTADFYWAGGALLPKEELANSDSCWPILYDYPKKLADPADMTEEEREAIRAFSSAENRKNGAGSAMFFFDFLYQADTRAHIEQHITRTSFLKHRANVHPKMIEPLSRLETRIFALAETDKEVKDFLANLKSNDSYLWRIIAGTKRKSFHSLGIAVEVPPKSQGGKQIFWSWAKDKYPNSWMLIPLKNRWMPPESVIEAFEEEGFIWGGKWAIYDNMHFEYRPELIEYNFRR